MTPLPRFASWDAFNGHLEEQCRNRQGNVLRGHRESIGERFVRDREALKRPLPAPFDACDKQGTRVNSLSLVRYRTNDYSVPVAYGHQEVWIRGYVHEVVIGCGAGIIARHPRSYDREDMVFDPIHYLPLLEHKIGALDQAAPLAGWELPDAFPTLRRLLEARMGKAGKREYVQVLRLVETFDLEVLHGAVKDALRLGAIGYDAVKHLVLCRIERRPPKLDLDIYPYLPRANVATTAAASYMSGHSPFDTLDDTCIAADHRQQETFFVFEILHRLGGRLRRDDRGLGRESVIAERMIAMIIGRSLPKAVICRLIRYRYFVGGKRRLRLVDIRCGRGPYGR